jgi:hypothetical protein
MILQQIALRKISNVIRSPWKETFSFLGLNHGAPWASLYLHAEVHTFAETFRADVSAGGRGLQKAYPPEPRLWWVIRRCAKSAEAY